MCTASRGFLAIARLFLCWCYWLLVSTGLQLLSVADDENFQQIHNDGEKFVDDVAVGASARHIDLVSDNELATSDIKPSTLQLKVSDNKYNDNTGPAGFTKRRKPPEYVGYAANVDPNIDTQSHSAKSKEFLVNTSGSVNGDGDKTNVIKLLIPDHLYGYGWKANEQRAWVAACRELNCVRGSMCVPDTLRAGQPRCQCLLGTDGSRCERRTSDVKIVDNNYLKSKKTVVKWLGRRTCDREVASSTPGRFIAG